MKSFPRPSYLANSMESPSFLAKRGLDGELMREDERAAVQADAMKVDDRRVATARLHIVIAVGFD